MTRHPFKFALAAIAAVALTSVAQAQDAEITEEVVEIAAEEGYEEVSIRDRIASTEYRLTRGTESLLIVHDKLSGRMTVEGEDGETTASHPGLKGIENALERHLRNAERRDARETARSERETGGNRGGGNGGGNGNGNGGGNGNGNGNGRNG